MSRLLQFNRLCVTISALLCEEDRNENMETNNSRNIEYYHRSV